MLGESLPKEATLAFLYQCGYLLRQLLTRAFRYLSHLRLPVAETGKNLPVIQENGVRSLGWEVPLEKGMAICSSILAWRIPWTEAWWATVHGVAKELVSNTHTHTHTHTLTHPEFMKIRVGKQHTHTHTTHPPRIHENKTNYLWRVSIFMVTLARLC